MTLAELFVGIAQLSGLLFVVTSMLSMGLSLTVARIVQPLRSIRVVMLALLANFVLVPLLAYLILRLIPLEESLQVGLIVLATAAGAPFLPRLVQGAKGNVALSVGLMVLLMVTTVIYMPIVLPMLVDSVQVRPWDIAESLIVLILVPLAIGLLIRSLAPDAAPQWRPVLNSVAGLALLVLMVVGLGLNIPRILGIIGTGGILALLVFILGAFAIGFLLGGRDPRERRVMALGTAQRNLAAAIVVTAQNFAGSDTLAFVLVGAILLLLILLPAALRLGGQQQPVEAEGPDSHS
jgi:BASS family bile acid:Na+ symporter